MMKQTDQILMHSKITKHSNLMIPFSDHVSALEFPEQNKQLLNTIVTLQYRNRYIADKRSVNIPSCGRPKDDIPFIEAGISTGDDNIIFSNDFRILRADITKPYKYIAISVDYKDIIEIENYAYVYYGCGLIMLLSSIVGLKIKK